MLTIQSTDPKDSMRMALITSVPNLVGWVGAVQKLANRRAYETHVPLDREMLKAAAQQAGLTVIHCDYVGSTNFHVSNL